MIVSSVLFLRNILQQFQDDLDAIGSYKRLCKAAHAFVAWRGLGHYFEGFMDPHMESWNIGWSL